MNDSTRHAESADRAAPGPIWDLAPYPMLAVTADGVITRLNDAARELFAVAPGAALADAVPAWLARAHRRYAESPREKPRGARRETQRESPCAGRAASAETARGLVGGCAYEARPTREAGNGDVVWWLVDGTDHRTMLAELRVERARVAFLAEASDELSASLDFDRCVQKTVRLATGRLADAAVVVVSTAGCGYRAVRCGPHGRVVHADLAPDLMQELVEVPGLAEVLRGFPPVPSRWIDPAAASKWALRAGLGEVGSVLVAPLPGHGAPAGALVLLRRAGHAAFSAGEEAFAGLFAARAAAAMSAARRYAEQASITEILIRDLLPPRTLRVDGVELAARYLPSGNGGRVGGDFYDLHPAAGAGQESLVVLGDVCGKGLEAAVLTGKIRNAVEALLPFAGDHRRMLGLLNEALRSENRAPFATLVLASVRSRRGRLRLRLTCAGHPAPLILRAGGRVEEVPTTGTLIGVLDRITAGTVTVTLAPGETCLLYTDGVTEAKGGPLGGARFGDERLRQELARCAGMPPEALVERVEMLASQWVGGRGHDDDMALIAITPGRASTPDTPDTPDTADTSRPPHPGDPGEPGGRRTEGAIS